MDNKAIKFIMDTTNIFIEAAVDSFNIKKIAVTGSRQETINENFYKLCTPNGLGINRASENIQELKKNNDTVLIAKFKDSLTYFNNRLKEMYWDFIEKNADTYTAVKHIKILQYTSLDTAKLQFYYQNYLSDYIKNTPLGREFNYKLLQYKDVIAQNISIPEFSLPDTAMKQVNVYDFNGKYVILDFWASWCGPCIEEFPELQRIYKKYKSMGVEVIGVSLDTDKQKWIKAINKYNLNWVHLSDLRGNESVPATLFYAISIPRKFLVGPDMKLIVNNGSLEQIEEVLSQKLLNNKQP